MNAIMRDQQKPVAQLKLSQVGPRLVPRSTFQQIREISIRSPKRLFQQYPPEAGASSLKAKHGAADAESGLSDKRFHASNGGCTISAIWGSAANIEWPGSFGSPQPLPSAGK
jgi:hypothetical protein